MPGKIPFKIIWLLVAVVQLLLILMCVSRISDEEILGLYFNTDYLYLPSLYQDIFVDHNSISGWKLTPAPYFFPDMPLYFLIYSITGSISYTSLIYAFIQLLLIEFFFYRILMIIIEDKIQANLLAITGCLFLQAFLLAGAVSNEAFTAHLVMANAAHLGSVLMSLVAFYFLFKYLKLPRKKYLVGLSFLIIVSILSDRIFIVQTLVPVAGISIYYLLKNKDYKPLLIILAGGVIGWFLFDFIRTSVINIPRTNSPFPMDQSIANFSGGFRYILRHFKVHRFILFFHITVLLVAPIAVFYFKNQNRSFLICLISSSVISFLFPILGGYMNAVDTFRYLMHSYIFILLFAPAVLSVFIKKNTFKVSAISLVSIYSVFIGSWGILNFRFEKVNYFFNFKPAYVKILEGNENRLKNGISDYWTTKQFYLLGKTKKRVVAVEQNFEANTWQANKVWYIENRNYHSPVFNFTFKLNANSILGTPLDSIGVYPDIIYIYPDFYFKTDSIGVIRIDKNI